MRRLTSRCVPSGVVMQRLAVILALSWPIAASPVMAEEIVYQSSVMTIIDDGSHDTTEIAYLRDEINNAFAVMAAIGFYDDNVKLPVKVIVKAGKGVSHIGERGEIVLHWLHEGRAPILHEVTHIVAGYDRSAGHWNPEGLASWVQDNFGSNAAYPTYREAPGLMKMLHDDDALLPMAAVFADRNRSGVFGKTDQWSRWRAYSQATSFVGYLIDTYGIEDFQRIYNRPINNAAFADVFGKSAEQLVVMWMDAIGSGAAPSQQVRNRYARLKASLSKPE